MKTLLQLIAGIVVSFGLAWLLRIDPTETYTWFMGIIHGFLFVPNWVMSLFDSSWLYEAPMHTQMYGVCWWACMIMNIIYWVWVLVGASITIVKTKK